MKEIVIVKIGGSCSSNLDEIIGELKGCIELNKGILIIPGGWIFADMVREVGVDDSTAHWMAIASMDIYGYYISSHGVKVIEADDFDFDVESISVLLPYRLLRKYDELPHSWDVTSDSISVWIAHKMGCKEVIKLTDVDGIIMNGRVVERMYAEDVLNMHTCIDRFCPHLMIEYGINIFVCNGLRVKDYILRGHAVGTHIIAHR
jgi:hypothetical protein